MDIQTISPGELLFSQDCGDLTAVAIARSVDDYGVWTEVVIKQGGAIRWSSPKTEDPEDALAFGVWFDGPALPQWFGEDLEGRVVLLAPRPKSDISPPIFRFLLFESNTVTLLDEGAYLAEPGSLVFSLVASSDLEGLDKAGRWLETFDVDKVSVTIVKDNSLPSRETASLKTVSRKCIELRV